MNQPPTLTVVVAAQTPPSAQEQSDVCVPDVIKKMSAAEKKVWRYVTDALKEAGLIHKTDAMLLHIIVKTFCRWVDAEEDLDKYIETNKTYIVKTPNGYEQPHQSLYVARQYKRELLQWLPEACLSIPAYRKAKNLMGIPQQQPDLFGGDPLSQFVGAKPKLVSS